MKDRYPRSLEEAFGPYQRGPIVDPSDPPFDWPDVLVGAACGVAVVCLLVILVVYG